MEVPRGARGIFDIAAIGIFLVLQAAFGNWRRATVVFLTLPSPLVGGVLAPTLVTGSSRLARWSASRRFWVSPRNGIMLFCHYQHLQCEVRMVFGPELVLRGAWERLALLLMTALATGLALVPLEVLESLFPARAEPCAV